MRRVIASRPLLLWLLLAAIICRDLIPAGFMPTFGGKTGIGLAFCSGGSLVIHADPAAGSGTLVMDECPYAAADVPTLPAVATAFALEKPDSSTVRTAAETDPLFRPARSQPPARGPPAAI